jgi:hypothetical protein
MKDASGVERFDRDLKRAAKGIAPKGRRLKKPRARPFKMDTKLRKVRSA